MKKRLIWLLCALVLILVPLMITAQEEKFDYEGIWYYEGIGNEKIAEAASPCFIEIKKMNGGQWLVLRYVQDKDTRKWSLVWGYASTNQEGSLVWKMEYPLYGVSVNIVQNNTYAKKKLFIDDGAFGFMGQFASAETLPKGASKPFVLPTSKFSGKSIKDTSCSVSSLPGMEYLLKKDTAVKAPMNMEVVDISGNRITLKVMGSKLHFTFSGLSYTHLSKFSTGQILKNGTEIARMYNAGKILLMVTDIVDGKRVFVNPETFQYSGGNYQYRYIVTYSDGTTDQSEWHEILAY